MKIGAGASSSAVHRLIYQGPESSPILTELKRNMEREYSSRDDALEPGKELFASPP